ncbi:Protein KRI1 like [Glycine soja]|uniref:Protein KRI1 like n=1 Tax=Glycine soja TaxID=3848 RepID=A0A0B2QNH1_GLYSO|nr:Protein KRI1 like [Glycine soja]
MPLQLFDGSDSENEDISKIKIDKEYARRFEHNKKREDLQRFEELKKKGVIDSPSHSHSEGEEESESESLDDDDDDYETLVNSRRRDKEFFDALIKVKKQDPILKQKDVRLFGSDDSSDDESDEKEKVKSKDKKGEKPMYLKDVVAKHLIEEGADFGDEEEEIDEKEKRKGKKVMPLKDKDFVIKDGKKTYGDEQEELKKAFLQAVEREGLEDGEEEFFSVKEKVGEEDKVDSDDKELEEKLDEYFGGDVESNENSKFLRSYFMNKLWIDKSGKNLNVGEDELDEISEDEVELERQEEYEYRFQENPGDRVLGHARKVEGSVRKKTNARKEQRKSKEERMAIEQKERRGGVETFKEFEEAGDTGEEIEEEFDPEEYDRMMKKAFDEKYYNAEDADLDFCSDIDDIEKPDFEKEDELLGLPKGWDACGSNGGFLAAREKALKEKIENTSDDDLPEAEDENERFENTSDDDLPEGEDEKEEKIPEEGSRKRKRKTALLEKARQAMMDEYYKLDYEDTIGDLKTRFKYAKTKPSRFGLSASEILLMDDKELNQYISLKKLAPYQEEEWKLSKQKRYMLKMRAKELLRMSSLDKKKRKNSKVDSGKITSSKSVENEKPSTEESNINTDNLSRKAKRRRQVANLKLSQSRLKAYGKIPSKSKHGGKH